MENLVSSWYTNVKSLPQDYVFPEDTRPGDHPVPIYRNFAVIDLEKMISGDRNDAIQQVLEACQDYGFFQVINHGVRKELIDDAMGIVKQFFNMPNEDKASLYSPDPQKSCRLYTSSFDYLNEPIHLWRDCLKHFCHPLDKWVHLWPQKPAKYRDVMGKYSVEVRNLSLRILEMIREGLRLEHGHFGDELTGVQMLTVNHYPPCPDPSLVMGLPKHCDPDLITVLYQGTMYGLQVFKDGQWLGVEPLPNAFVVNTGQLLKVISNGKLKCGVHRVVANSKEPRYTIVSFINPHNNSVIEPAKSLVDKDSACPLYRPFQYKEFHRVFQEHRGECEAILEAFEVKD